jgi:DNA-directed RNA polymerase subunit E'/Rpb7
MLIKKVFNVSVDLFESKEIYNKNLDEVILRKLKNNFEGKCYTNMLILTVDRIIKRSFANLTNDRLDGSVYIDVSVEVEGIVFVEGEIIHECKISDTTQSDITAEYKYAAVKLVKLSDIKNKNPYISKLYQILKKGDYIPIKISVARYQLASNCASLIGYPYISEYEDPIIFNITEGINARDQEKLADIIEKISEEEKLHQAIKKEKSYDFFQKIMYPFKVNQVFTNVSEFSEFKSVVFSGEKNENVMNRLSGINKGYVIYPCESNRLNREFFHCNNYNGDRATIPVKLYGFITLVFSKFLVYLQGLRGFYETYPTLEKVSSLDIYLKICMSGKL